MNDPSDQYGIILFGEKMSYSDARLVQIFSKTGGYCFYCGDPLVFEHYGLPGLPGAWEVDHGRPKSLGGTEHLNNLHPSCLDCNRDKGDAYPYR